MRIYEPNYTQVPNAIISLMPALKEAELKVLLAIVRKTIGWQKKRDRISLTQLQRLTGMGRASVVNAVKSEKLEGVIKVHKTEKGNEYEMIIHSMNSEPSKKEVVQNLNQHSSKSEPVGSSKSEHTIDTYTKETKQKKRDRGLGEQFVSLSEEKKQEFQKVYDKSKHLLCVPIPDKIDRQDEYWLRKWVIHLAEMGKVLTHYAQEEMLLEASKLHSIKDTVKYSMSNNWKSLHAPDTKKETSNFVTAPEDAK